MKKIRVLIVEDSSVVTQLLLHILAGDPRFEVLAAVSSAEEALALLRKVSPDVISLDIRLPGMDGLEATRQIMKNAPTPIVVCSASIESDELKISMNALRAGALSVVEKPVGTTRADYDRIARTYCTQLAIMSDVKVVRQRTIAAASEPASYRPRPSVPPGGLRRILGIGASTGGPNAVVQVLRDLGADFSLPILVVQHMLPSFLTGFASWLDGAVPGRAVIAKDGAIAMPGTAYLAPADHHLRIDTQRLRLTQSPPVSLQRPSATVMFQSMAETVGPTGVGVLLTGMGNDGAEGLLALRRAGGYTIAEHESTTVVYGMPKAAVDCGAACESVPLHSIGRRVLELVSVGQEV